MGAKGKDVEKRLEKLGKKVKELDARLAELEKAAKEAKKAKKAEKARESAGGVPDAAPVPAPVAAEVATESGDPIATESAPAAEIAADAPSAPEVETREDG